MNCSSCGFQLPPGAKVCPNCGTLTPAYYTNFGASANDPTVASSSSTVPPGSPPPTFYGTPPPPPPSMPYGVLPPEAYTSNPYGGPLSDPYSVVPSPHRGRNIAIFTGLGILVLVLIGASVFAFMLRSPAVQPTSTGLIPSQITATANAGATATANIEGQNPYPPFGGNLVLNDPLKDNSKGYQWDQATFADGGVCSFGGGTYHAIKSQQGLWGCNPEVSTLNNVQNFAFQVQMMVIKGDTAGIFFRALKSGGAYYFFIFPTGQGTGTYALVADTAAGLKTLKSGSSASIKTGANASNMLAVVANGSTLTAYANLQTVATVNDSTFNQGYFGVATQDDGTPADVAFTNAKAWML